jgi:hypothetical protein
VTGSQRKAELYCAGNLAAARIILSDIDRYGGEESLMVRWARLVMAGSKSIRRAA